jgi:signal transduction histidine kinase/ActR/RegA family two-component response regulator
MHRLSTGGHAEQAGAGEPPSPGGTPLRRRLFVLSAAGILPLAVMAGIGLQAVQSRQNEQTERVGLELSRSVANAVDAELRSAIAVLETLATSPTLDRSDLAGFREQAERIRRLRPEWAAIVLAAPDTATLVDTRAVGNRAIPPVYDRESFGRVLQTQTATTGNLTRGPQADWFFPVRVPVLRDGAVKFVLSAIITPETIRAVLVRQRLPADWVISIVDAKTLRVARSRAHEENLGGRLSESVQQVVDSGGAEGFGIAYTLEGERIFTPYSRLPNGWGAVLGLPTALVDAAGYRALAIYGGGILLSIALGALAALYVARTITQPIAALRRAAQAVGRRQHPTLPDTSIQEIRDVAAAIGAAAGDLARGEAEREELLRKERQARETAEAADRAKDEFMAVLSHELRTPLNAVSGWGRLLQTGQLRDEAAAKRARDAIVRNADVQMQLIDDLLDLSRIVSGKLRLDVRRLELPQVLQAAVDAVRPAAEGRGIHIETAFDAEAPAINADPGRVQQVVWNLLMNAVKFTPRGGQVRLCLDRLGSHVRIVVRDTGQGMTPDLLPHIFERFRQADSSSTRPHGGLGLGLSLVKHLVELHGGTVHAESPGPGQGATFTVALPIALDIPAGAPSVTPAAPGFERRSSIVRLDGLRILVVDDDGEGLALAETILLRAGAEVRVCTSAAAALDLVRDGRPDVLVSDIEMPGEDGYSLIRKVRALPDEEGGATPAIALTAYGRTQDRVRALAAGFTMHVPKPVDPGELTTLIAGIAGRPEQPQGS